VKNKTEITQHVLKILLAENEFLWVFPYKWQHNHRLFEG